jgi:hypothetical protein
MDSELLHALCALAVFALPMYLAWFIVSRSNQPKKRRHGRSE